MSDEDEQKINSNSKYQSENDIHRRSLEIKKKLHESMRQKKQYDEEKLKQDAEFLQSEIHDIRNSIIEINKEINRQTQTKRKLHVEMTNFRSRSRIRYTNLSIAVRDKRRYEAELKKENKTEEYRELARREIRSIEDALPILKEEDEYKGRIRIAEDAQQAATNRRKKLEENLNKDLKKQIEVQQLLSTCAEKLPEIEKTIEHLRSERERLSLLTNEKKSQHRLSKNRRKNPIDLIQVTVQDDRFENEKYQIEDRIDKIDTLLNYFREKSNEHGLNNQINLTPSTELKSPLCNSITPTEEKSILSSFMDEKTSDNVLLIKTTNVDERPRAIAMKLPRSFAPLDFNLSTQEIIHSPYYQGNEIEYKKELSSDIINKYGGQPKNNKQQQFSLHGKKHKKNRKHINLTHVPQMMSLYNNVRSSTDSNDTLPLLPLYEYELYPVIQSLEFLKQNLQSYLNELSSNQQKPSVIEMNDDDDVPDSVLDTFSETSSLIEPTNSTKQIIQALPKLLNIDETHSSTSSEDKKTIASSSSSNHGDQNIKENLPSTNDTIQIDEESNSNSLKLSIDRQQSDEGYRSVRSDQQRHITDKTSSHNSPVLNRSKSYDCTDKVDQWLSTTTNLPLTSSLPKSFICNTDFQSTTDMDD